VGMLAAAGVVAVEAVGREESWHSGQQTGHNGVL